MFKLEFDTGNAAYQDEGGIVEVQETLKDVVDRIERGDRDGVVLDPNGNTVGSWKLEGVE